MDRLKMQTENKADANFRKLAELFPNVVTETIDENGEVVRAIDKDMLLQEISAKVVEGRDERYQFTWPGKRKAVLAANAPSTNTLRPCREESVNFDTTENLYIEGDNLEVLKLLQENYLGKVKMIYIDPPYNTGNDFVYEDDFAQSIGEYMANSGQYDYDGNRLFTNTESNGRFHTDWLNMFYPRVKMGRNLLSDEGLMFTSCDDNELENILKICDEIFGPKNRIAILIIKNNPRGRQSDSFVATVHEYLVCYCKNKLLAKVNGMPLTEEQQSDYCYEDENGKYRLLGLRQRGSASLREDRPDMYFPVYVSPDGQNVSLEYIDGWYSVLPKKSDGRDGRWMWGKAKCKNEIYRLVPKLIERRQEYDIFVKDYMNRDGEIRTRKYQTIWDDSFVNNQVGTQEVGSLIGSGVMSFPKSRPFIEQICAMGCDKDSIVVDFFSGSATTAHAIMSLNASDNGNRKFIMVQLPEPTDEKSIAFKSGYKNMCEIGKERIRKAAQLLSERNNNIDLGFRVLKLDSSNMQQVWYSPNDYVIQDLFEATVDNVKSDRSAEDLLFQAMLELDCPLSSKIETVQIHGKTLYNVAEGYLMACFEEGITDDIITEIAKKTPYFFVMRDSSLANDSVAVNFEQIFKSYSPETKLKVF